MSKLKSVGKDRLQEIFDTSFSKKEILEKVGLKSKGSNYVTLDRYIKDFNINLDMFLYNNKNKDTNNLKIDNDKIFIQNSSYNNNNNIKKRMIQDYCVEYKCSICGIHHWNDKELSLQLDHINGDNRDNRLENLRLLCPNCHSQTNTFAGKNIKNKIEDIFCIDCGNKISHYGKYQLCSSCANKKNRSKKKKI